MRTPLALLLGMLAAVAGNAAAAECHGSFYCYGDTASSVVNVAARPPPIPPPDPRRVALRRQAQLALRNAPPPPPTLAATTNLQPRTVPMSPVPPTTQPFAPIAMPSCQARDDRAAYLESQAVLAAKAGEHTQAVQLFQAAAQVRKQTCR